MRPIFWNAWAFIASVTAILLTLTAFMSALMATDEGSSKRFAFATFALAAVIAALVPFLLDLAERAA